MVRTYFFMDSSLRKSLWELWIQEGLMLCQKSPKKQSETDRGHWSGRGALVWTGGIGLSVPPAYFRKKKFSYELKIPKNNNMVFFCSFHIWGVGGWFRSKSGKINIFFFWNPSKKSSLGSDPLPP